MPGRTASARVGRFALAVGPVYNAPVNSNMDATTKVATSSPRRQTRMKAMIPKKRTVRMSVMTNTYAGNFRERPAARSASCDGGSRRKPISNEGWMPAMNRKIVKTAMPIHKARAALNRNPVSLTLCTEELPTDIGIHFTMRVFRVKKCRTLTMRRDVAKIDLRHRANSCHETLYSSPLPQVGCGT
jgi:hypothetical protein